MAVIIYVHRYRLEAVAEFEKRLPGAVPACPLLRGLKN
jgi:hypothetical protein